jgi:HK97 family phage portal protein
MTEQRPGIVQRLRLAAQVYRDGMPARYRKATPMRWPDFRVNTPQWQIINIEGYIEEGFNANSLIYSAVMYKARAISGVPLRAYTGEQDEPETLPDDNPLAMLCARPNPSQSWREFMMLQTVFLNITGNAYSYIDRQGGVGDVPGAIIPLNPLRTYIVPGTRGTIKGFLYVPEGVAMADGIPLLAQDVSHVKLPNPADPLDGQGYGLSPISSMARSADVDNSITKFLKTFFDKGTNVGGILEFDVPMTDADIARVRTRWSEIYGGVDNWDQVGVLDQTGEYKRIGYSFDEMGFEVLDERNETRILGPFGVPPILIGSRVGLARSTYSNYEQARDAFWQDTAIHEMRLFEDDFQYHLSSGGAWVAFDYSDVPAFQNDLPPIVDAWVKLVNLGVPKAQAAEVVGLPLGELEDGDVAYMPLGLVPLNEAAEARQANRDALATANEERRNGNESDNAETDGRNKSDLPVIFDVKKNYSTRTNGASGKKPMQLVGTTNAGSQLARKARWRKTAEKSSAD